MSELKLAIRDVDDKFQRKAAPDPGAVARAESGKLMTNQMFDDLMAHAELLWAQKYARGGGLRGSNAPTGRPAAVYTMCYLCGDKGHYARDCPKQATAKCSYCHKTGHKEKACKIKARESEEAGARAGGSGDALGEASFFHGKAAECNMVIFCSGKPRDFGKLFTNIAATTVLTYWLYDTGASHHICRDKALFTNMRMYTWRVPNSAGCWFFGGHTHWYSGAGSGWSRWQINNDTGGCSSA